MVLETLNRVGQKVVKENESEFGLMQPYEELSIKNPLMLEVGKYPVSEATAIADTKQIWNFQYYTWKELPSAAAVFLEWEEKLVERPTHISEEALINSWEQYLDENWDELVTKYKEEYVAIWKGTVYDSDKDLATLAKRVYAALGYRSIFMPYMGARGRVAEFSSPI